MKEDNDGQSEQELRDFLRRYGYYVPETEDEAQDLRRALDLVVGIVVRKRSLRDKAGAAFIWGLVITLTGMAVKETWTQIAEALGIGGAGNG